MRILITGAAGRLGYYLISTFANNHELFLVDRNPPKEVPDNCEFRQVDFGIMDSNDFDNLIKWAKPEIVIHLASLLGPICEQNPDLAYKINCEATKLLAESAIKNNVQKFIFASTSAVYDQKALSATSETQNVNPKNVYGKTKLATEAILNELSPSDTQFIVLRMFNIYGGIFNDSLIYKLSNSTIANPVELINPQDYYRDYIYIDDIVKAFELSIFNKLNSKFEIINISSGKAYNTIEVIEELKKQNILPITKTQETKSALQSISWGSIEKAKTMLGFQPNQAIIIDKSL